ncbi:MAG: glutathione peroxidase [Phycisphaerae bacterium]|jgi:glutathione peroxidase|nr:MAG: glutathione peroxidase [Phycisphaerae bacterium]
MKTAFWSAGCGMLFLVTGILMGSRVNAEPTTQPVSALDYVVRDIDEQDYDLSRLKGQVVLIVNVASRCGFTKQYSGLENLYKTYRDKGFVVIGFPADDFNQEPGSNQQIKEFCTSRFNVTFPMMAKISVKGEKKHPVYRFLTEEPTAGKFAGEIKWNFNKFLIGRDGKVLARYDSKVGPEDQQLLRDLEKALAE